MQAGKLNTRVTIQALTAGTPNEWGRVSTWTDYASRWANVKPEAAAEPVVADGVQSRTTYIISMRYDAAITDQHRIIYAGKTLDIVSAIDVEGRKRELIIKAIEHPQDATEPEPVEPPSDPEPEPEPEPTPVSVVQVSIDHEGTQYAVWQCEQPVTAITSAAGLKVNGLSPIFAYVQDGKVWCEYDGSSLDAQSTWACEPTAVNITFAQPSILQASSGTIYLVPTINAMVTAVESKQEYNGTSYIYWTLWYFNHEVVSVNDVVGLKLNGESPISYTHYASNIVSCEYPAGYTQPGDTWECDAGYGMIQFMPDVALDYGTGSTVGGV